VILKTTASGSIYLPLLPRRDLETTIGFTEPGRDLPTGTIVKRSVGDYMQVCSDGLRAVPFLAVDGMGDRVVNLMPMWDGTAWHQWLPVRGGLMKVQIQGLAVGEYLARVAEASTDLSVLFLEFAWQRASWPELCDLWRHLTDDVHNFATCVAKIEHFVAERDRIGLGASAFVETELEYLLVLARSVFDLLQELIARVWKQRARLLDPAAEAERKRHALPAEFSRIVLRGKSDVRSAEEIAARFPVSSGLAGAYSAAGAFFSRLRDVRDSIVHGGKATPMVFLTDDGPSIHRTAPILEALGISATPEEQNSNLLSLWPLVAHVVFGVLTSCDRIVDALARDLLFPPPLAPGYSVFIRDYHNESLARLRRGYSAGL
jgi:hypothetical protein